ncbi:hypothetical protein GLOIN_2v1870151 [Rhizophagus clarus]|uniref:RNase H type-1 domain-containing protein n=1 Tax=Rhizophagus clarus TaxID=94130 RepID=A0A8H3L2Q9_9GLOM|nr:hypothetical protein GLOIN_2v1870151 [Rhizophagus clarus]
MGIRWVILNEEEEVMLECSSSITDWLLFTYAELGAIFKLLEIILIKVKGHLEIKGNREVDRVVKNNTKKSTCIKIKDMQQKDLTYNIYWNGIRIDRHIRKFMDNLCKAILDAV